MPPSPSKQRGSRHGHYQSLLAVVKSRARERAWCLSRDRASQPRRRKVATGPPRPNRKPRCLSTSRVVGALSIGQAVPASASVGALASMLGQFVDRAVVGEPSTGCQATAMGDDLDDPCPRIAQGLEAIRVQAFDLVARGDLRRTSVVVSACGHRHGEQASQRGAQQLRAGRKGIGRRAILRIGRHRDTS